MPKETVRRKHNQHNAFAMKGASFTYYPLKVVVDFPEQKSEGRFVHPAMRDLVKHRIKIPTFNNDHNHYTPAFTLPNEPVDTSYYLGKHHSKLQQHAPISESDIMMPKPKDKFYCHVCEQKFQDYQQHITSAGHEFSLSQDKFQRRILKLCKKIYKRNHLYKNCPQKAHSDIDDSLFQHESKENQFNSNNQTQTTN